MNIYTIHSSWGDIELDLDNPRDDAYLTAVTTPSSVDDPTVRSLVNDFDPNTIAGLHLFTNLASVGKLDGLIEKSIILGKISPISYSGLRTALGLVERNVFKSKDLDEINFRFSVDEFISLDTDAMPEADIDKPGMVPTMIRFGIFTPARIDEMVQKVDLTKLEDVDILTKLAEAELLTDQQIEVVSERLDIADFDLSDEDQVVVLEELYSLGAIRDQHLQAIRSHDPQSIAGDLFREQVGISDQGFGL